MAKVCRKKKADEAKGEVKPKKAHMAVADNDADQNDGSEEAPK
jgi:hypothetical protein